MGSVLGGILGVQNNYKADNGGQDFGQAIQQAQAGINSNFQNQGNLAQALMQQMNGTGPNPAQAMLNQATDNNIKQNTAMMASQKGINAGATQRQAALNAASQGQQAVGQGALMGAQQQLAAQGQLGSLYGQMGAQQQANQNGFQGALANDNSINSGVSQANTNSMNSLTGGLMGAAGSIGASMLAPAPKKMSHGGPVPGAAPVKGDSPKNDTVHAMLSPGEIVVPRSKASDPAKAKEFIDHIMGQQVKASSAPSFGEIAKLKERIKALEKRVKA